MIELDEDPGVVYTSSVALAELFVWASKRPDPRKVRKTSEELLDEDVTLVNYDLESADEFGRVRIGLRDKGSRSRLPTC